MTSPHSSSSNAETPESLPLQRSPSWWQQLQEDMNCVFDRDPAARNRWEVATTYPGFHAIVLHRIAHILWRRRLKYLARLLSTVARTLTQIEIHPAAIIGRRFFIDHGSGVVIGETTEIGDDVTLYHSVTLGGTSWDRGKRHPTVADGVVIGTGAKILGPITVGKNARVGANSVVVKDVPPEMTVVGIPGRVVLPLHCRRITEHGIDLDHHLMPDPVGKAIESLIERINSLEAEIQSLRHQQSPPTTFPEGIPTPLNGHASHVPSTPPPALVQPANSDTSPPPPTDDRSSSISNHE